MRLILFILLFVSFLNAQEYTYSLNHRIITAKDSNNNIVWQNCHDKNHRIGRAYWHKPIVLNKFVYYAIGQYIYWADKNTGKVQDYIAIPGYCADLFIKNNQVYATIKSIYEPYQWTKEIVVAPENYYHGFGFSVDSINMHKKDALYALQSILMKKDKEEQNLENNAPEEENADQYNNDYDYEYADTEEYENLLPKTDADYKKPELQPYLKEAIPLLEKEEEWDSTNLWFKMLRCLYSFYIGEKEQCNQIFESIMAVDSNHQLEILQFISMLDTISLEYGNRAFHKVMKYLMQHGYEPENTSILYWLIYIGRPFHTVSDDNLDYANTIGNRLWDFAPFAMNPPYLYHELMLCNEKANRPELAKLWQERQKRAEVYWYSGYPSKTFFRSDLSFYIFLASILSMLFYLFIKKIYYIIPYFKNLRTSWKHWNILALWKKSELIGLILLLIVCFVSYQFCLDGLRLQQSVFDVPASCFNGFPASPDNLYYLTKHFKTIDEKFIQAFLLQCENKLDQSKSLYHHINSAESWNNIGVIEYKQGNLEQAHEYFTRAADYGSIIAKYNLDESISNDRIERLKKYNVSKPYTEFPTAEMWEQKIFTNSKEVNLNATYIQSFARIIYDRNQSLFSFKKCLAYLYFLVFGCAILALFSRRPSIEPPIVIERFHTVMSLAIPGISPIYSFLGGIVLLLCFFSLQLIAFANLAPNQSGIFLPLETEFLFDVTSLVGFSVRTYLSSIHNILISMKFLYKWILFANVILVAIFVFYKTFFQKKNNIASDLNKNIDDKKLDNTSL